LSTASPRVLQVLVAAIVIALASFATGYITSPGKVTTVTETATVTETTVSPTTTTVYRDINVTVYSQDPEVNLSVSPVYFLNFSSYIVKLRVYVTNHGNTSKTNLMLIVVFESQYGYESKTMKIDVIEPGVTLRYDIDAYPPATRYYILLAEART